MLTAIILLCASPPLSPHLTNSPAATQDQAAVLLTHDNPQAGADQQIQTTSQTPGVSTGALAVLGLVAVALVILAGYAVKKNGDRRAKPLQPPNP